MSSTDTGAGAPHSAEDPPRTSARPSRESIKVIRAALLGTIVEYYDFAIYGYMISMIAVHFFVESDPAAATLNSFAAFAVAFFLRVPGGIVFGHVGDRYGRKRALTWTILLMAVATAGIGLIPSYATLGIWATVLLVLCRCLQGFAAGGELAGANAFVSEHAPREWRAFQTSFVNTGTYLGSLLAALVALGLTGAFGEDVVEQWAWRLPFLLSVVIGAIGLYIRSQLEETEQFEAAQTDDAVTVARYPVTDVVRHAWRQVVQVVGLTVVVVGGYYICSIYATSYLQTEGGRSAQFAFASTCLAMLAACVSPPLSGYVGDRIGRRPVFVLGSLAIATASVPLFMLMRDGSPLAAVIAQCTLAFLIGIVNGVLMATCAELFPARYRYSGIALGNNLTNMTMGGTAPFIAALLVDRTGNSLAPAGYLVFTALLTMIAGLVLTETRGIKLKL